MLQWPDSASKLLAPSCTRPHLKNTPDRPSRRTDSIKSLLYRHPATYTPLPDPRPFLAIVKIGDAPSETEKNDLERSPLKK